MEIKWPRWNRIINDHFVPSVHNKDRYLIEWGGRGSAKSDSIAKKLIFRCLSEKYFRYLLVRENYNTVKNSQWQTLKDIITDLGLESLFRFKETPLEITCVNGNKFIAVGCDNVAKIKSVKDPSGAWYEEDIPDEADWITITTSIRTGKAAYLQEVFTINPEVEGAYEDNWFWKRFFKGQAQKSFRGKTVMEVDKRKIELAYTSHHSTYHDNRWITDEFKAFLESMKITNPYYYTIYTLGEWGNKLTGARAYKAFDRAKHLTSATYNPDLPIHATFDFNVKPYMTLTLWQVYTEPSGRRRAIQFDEILGTDPLNNTKGVCRLFRERYHNHVAGLFVYGDPAGRHEDTRGERGFNDYAIIAKELAAYSPRTKVAEAAPPVVQRIAWINAVLSNPDEYNLELLFNEKLNHTVMDYIYGKEAADGTKFKEKDKDESGAQFERYHHITDANDYFLTMIFRSEFNSYLRGNRQRQYLAGEARSNFQR